MMKQKTLSRPVSISGKGLHTGKTVHLSFLPAEENEGYVFKRVDIDNQPLVHANLDNVADTSRGTTLQENGVKVCTVEHALAALRGLSVDNALIEVDNEEMPILDGSAAGFVEAITKAGVTEQNAAKKVLTLQSNVHYYDEKNKVEMLAVPSDRFRVTCMIDYDSHVLGIQYAVLDDISAFKDEIAPCRTFVFLHELEYLLKNNLIKGGDLDNAIVFVDRIISQEELDYLAEVFKKPKVKVLNEGILNNLELHFPNEPARHKLLDVIGDVSLLGGVLNAHLIVKRPGHYANVQFAKKIAKECKPEIISAKKKDTPLVVDINKPPLYDVLQIQKMLPHRYPFLLIDKIIEMDERSVVGIKNVTINESFFVGHFPNEPIMPGVLQIEAMAQCGGVFVLNTVPDPENYSTYFMKIENARFKNKVVPGDTLIFKLELISPIRRGICHMAGKAYVGEKIVMEAELLAQIVKKENS